MEVGGGRGRWSGHRVEGLLKEFLKDSYYVLTSRLLPQKVVMRA